jgi:Ca-activated chloride channel family protein
VSFEHPRLLPALLLLLPLFLGALIHWRKRRALLDLFPGGGAGPDSETIRRRYALSTAAFLVFFACLVLALAGPRRGFRWIEDFRRGSGLVLALDLSLSMDIRDGGGSSRLERAVAVGRALVRHPAAGGETRSYAAVIGKGSAVPALPLTGDTEAVLNFLEGISTAAITGRGTNLERLVDAAAGAYPPGFPGRRRILLFSDGEALEGNLPAALDRAAAADITILALGFGSEAGSPLSGGAGEDSPPISRQERTVLEDAARRTGGVYIDGMREDAARLLEEALSRLDAGTLRREGGRALRKEARPVASAFIMAGLAAFILSKAYGLRRKPRGAP